MDTSTLVQTRGGTTRYVLGLLEHLEKEADVERLQMRHDRSGRAEKASGALGKVASGIRKVQRDVWWYWAQLPRSARNADLLHCPTFRGPLFKPKVPLVVTVHDLAVLHHPEWFNPWTRFFSKRAVPRALKAADAIIAVSKFTRDDVLERFPWIDEERVTVVPNGVTVPFTAEGPKEPGEYVLGVGNLEPRKNWKSLIDATTMLGLKLRIVGSEEWGEKLLESADAEILRDVDDERLAALYRGAMCFVYPSLWEGFALPVLEAMACGAPVVTSGVTATRELAEGAAVLVDPNDVHAIATGIQEAMSRRDELREAGLARAREYSWETTCALTLRLYESVLGNAESPSAQPAKQLVT